MAAKQRKFLFPVPYAINLVLSAGGHSWSAAANQAATTALQRGSGGGVEVVALECNWGQTNPRPSARHGRDTNVRRSADREGRPSMRRYAAHLSRRGVAHAVDDPRSAGGDRDREPVPGPHHVHAIYHAARGGGDAGPLAAVLHALEGRDA